MKYDADLWRKASAYKGLENPRHTVSNSSPHTRAHERDQAFGVMFAAGMGGEQGLQAEVYAAVA